MRYYIAYGSNLSVEQMWWRCPDAHIVGFADLDGWKLAFGRHATIEPCAGAHTPALIWEISDKDERALDRYEGYPKYYYKAWLPIEIWEPGADAAFEATAMVYIMADIQKDGFPSKEYVRIIEEGYQRFNFEKNVLEGALAEVGMSLAQTE